MTRLLNLLNHWALLHPWQARLMPLMLWLCFLPLAHLAATYAPTLLIVVYGAQIFATASLLWFWRKHFPEISLRFHWQVLPTSALVFALWLGMGWLLRGTFRLHWDNLWHGTPLPASTSALAALLKDHPALGWATLIVRLINMTLVIPWVEELFFRSAVPRTLPSWTAWRIALARFPLLEFIAPSPALAAPKSATLGHWSWAGALTSCALFSLNHQQVDWAGAAATGLLWNALTYVCNKQRMLGLGPALWSHASVNAALWIWCVSRGDWGFF